MAAGEMQGKTVVITGGNSGIGLETAVALARAGARTIITARGAEKGSKAVAAIRSRSGNESVEVVVFDLASLESTRHGAARILDLCPHLDVLINNAGVVLTSRQETADGFEATLGVNHLGPFYLTRLLRDRLEKSAPSRIVNVSSTAHSAARRGLDFDDLQSTRAYRGMQVYAKSKLANIYFTTELARRLAGSGVTANALHPGTVRTGYGGDGDATGILALGLRIGRPFFLSPRQGAATSVYLASSPEVDGVTGKYFVKKRPRNPSRVAQDPEAAAKLWEASEELIAKAGF